MQKFLIVSMIINAIFAVIWTRKTYLNLAFKIFFFGMTLWAFALYIKNFLN